MKNANVSLSFYLFSVPLFLYCSICLYFTFGALSLSLSFFLCSYLLLYLYSQFTFGAPSLSFFLSFFVPTYCSICIHIADLVLYLFLSLFLSLSLSLSLSSFSCFITLPCHSKSGSLRHRLETEDDRFPIDRKPNNQIGLIATYLGSIYSSFNSCMYVSIHEMPSV